MRSMSLAAAAVLLLMLAAPAMAQQSESTTTASAEAPAARDCFQNAQMTRWGLVDQHSIRVTINPSRSYLLTSAESLRTVRWVMGIVVHSRSGWICTGHEPGIYIDTLGDVGQSYLVDSVTRLPPQSLHQTEQQPAPH